MSQLRETFAELGMARDMLAQFSYPMLLVDEARGIWHRNNAAQTLLDTVDVICERGGQIFCRDTKSDLKVTAAIQNMFMSQAKGAPKAPRRVVSLKSASGHRWLAFISWITSESAMGSFGPRGRTLVTLHDPASSKSDLDPFIVAECFDLTPAEARVAVQVAAGANSKQIAQRTGTALPTVRTHLQRVLQKTGVDRQADLIRVLLALPSRTVL